MSALLLEARPVHGTGALLTIDLTAVADNARMLAASTAAELMAVVKADGFGHGAVGVARAALDSGATRLGVTSLAEAFVLRDAGLRAPVLSWLNPVDADFAMAAHRDIDLAVPSHEHLAAIARVGGGARVHLHLDTGLARDGAPPDAWVSLCRAARRAELQGRLRVVGVMGHLSCADDPANPANAAGKELFLRGVAAARASGLRPLLRHLAATAATITDPGAHFDLVRVGAGLVGIDPTRTTTLRAAMTLTAPVVNVRRVRAGTPVGYGHTWRPTTATTLALVPVGYGDGLPRAAAGRAQMLLRGRRREVVGRISMDQIVIDVGDDPVAPGETVTIFGPGTAGEPTVADWASWAESIDHEIVTGLGSRLLRHTISARSRS
ncbi:MAG TPA: alanine racemase [Micromonosporaceae bacterium]|nr:alanine racemase [Micromonosporaceae bacterium]